MKTRIFPIFFIIIFIVGLCIAQSYNTPFIYPDPTQILRINRDYLPFPKDYTPFDFHPIARGIYTVYNEPIIELFDMGLDCIIPGKSIKPFEFIFVELQKGYESIPENYVCRKVDELVGVFRIEQIAISDFTSYLGAILGGGNSKRVNFLIDWVQSIFQDMDSVLGLPFGLKGLLQIRYLNKGIDSVQNGVEKASDKVKIFALKGIDKGLTFVEKPFKRKNL